MGASAHAKSDVQKSNVHIGVFNSKQDAQKFYETLPRAIKNSINVDQLWLDVYKSNKGFLEHHINISNLNVGAAEALCQSASERSVQCITSGVEPLFPSAPDAASDAAPKGVRAVVPVVPARGLTDMLGAMGMQLRPVSDHAVETLELALSPTRVPPFTHQENLQTYGDGFTLQAHDLDTAGAQAAKAAYDTARDELLAALQNIDASADEGQAARDGLMALGREAFEAAGGAYLSGFLEREIGSVAALSGDAGTGEAFVHHVKKNLSTSAQATVEGLVDDVLSRVSSGEGVDAAALSKTADALILSGARGVIDAGLIAARRSDLYALRHLELEYNLNDFENAYVSVLATQPVYQSIDLRHNVFVQGGGIINEQSVDIDDDVARHTLNIGAAYRYLTVDEKYLLGGNVFFDHQWPYNHSRLGLGVDAKAENLNLAANYYHPLSGFKDSRRDASGVQYEERVLKGYDLELGYQLPFVSDLSVFAKGYQYFRETDDDLRGLALSAEYKILDHFTLKGAVVEENGGRDGVEFALQYSVPLYDVKKPNLVLADLQPAAGTQSQRSKIFEKVRRENRIRVEERVKSASASVAVITAQFNALSTGLPFVVGGAATSSGVDLPFDTAITVPNGDFGIITFSNGAVANLSASGGGSVVVEFNASTLTVTATNGGFVQFISGSGGISTVNVPGGTVNLLGTDIDVTDDGTTTTVQVRAGQIQVVPDVGVDVEAGNQADVVSLTIASGATSLLVDPALETRQEAAFASLDLINPDPSGSATAAPFINVLPVLVTGPQFVGNNADLRLTFTQPVSVAGAPLVNGVVGINARSFAYNAAASTPTQLVFRYVYVAGDVGAASITINDLDLNGGTISGTANGLDALTAFTDTIVAVTDQTAPSLMSLTPVDGEPLFSSGANIVLNFDGNVQAGIGNITITDTTDGSSTLLIPIGDAQVSIVGSSVTIDPVGILDLSTDYDLTIPAGVIEDAFGNGFAGIGTGDLNFTTSNDVTPPMLTGAAPLDNATQVARNATITLTFDEDVALLGTLNVVDTDNGSGTVAYTSASSEVSVVNNVISITPAANLEYAENYEVTWSAGAVQDLLGNNAAASNAGDLNFQTVNLEATLAITGTTGAAADGDINEDNVQGAGYAYNRSGDGVWATDITISAAPNGVIYECGATGSGNWVGFNNADGVFRARSGIGTSLPQNNAANAEEPLASFPAGDYTLTWDYDVSMGRIRVWLDDNLVASDTSVSGNFNSGAWAGTDNCGYGTTASGVPTGEITTSYNGTLNSGLRYYSGQTLP